MPKIAAVETGFYRIPLPVTLTDSMHGDMKAFELVIVRVRDVEGAEGTGYTYTVGRNGGAIADILRREIPEIILNCDAEEIEHIWQKTWWGLHYGGRGGPSVLALSALDIALWDLKARRAATPLWRLLGGFDHRVPCYAGGIDLDLPLDDLLKQTDENLGKGFRAIKMKVGRPDLSEDIARAKAMREHLGDGSPRRMPRPEGMDMTNLLSLGRSTVGAPTDDGAAGHLDGLSLLSIPLPATNGRAVDLSRIAC